jgi:phage host-nuclease inhibitor protein Gam
MKTLAITSPESLDAAVADVVRLKITRTRYRADVDAAIAEIEKSSQPALTSIDDEIKRHEAHIIAYCEAKRPDLFPDKKSRETSLAVFGFRITPPRVETSSRKIKWADVVVRLLRLSWGKAYVRQADPKPDKDALLADRTKLTPEQLTAAGIQFCQDEEFFIDPKPETASIS